MTTMTSGRRERACSTAAGSRMRFGWKTGVPRRRASSFIGEARSRCERPAGLSGWVMTPATECPRKSVSSAGTPMPPVPMKRIRTDSGEEQARRARALGAAGGGGLAHQLVAGGDFLAPERGGAPRAKVVVDFLVRQDEEEAFADGHRGFAPVAVKRGGPEVFELARAHREEKT